MPYNTVRLLRRRRLYSNFLQFSDNFGLAALVRLAVADGRARAGPGPGVNGGVRRAAVNPSSVERRRGGRHTRCGSALWPRRSVNMRDNILALQFCVTTLHWYLRGIDLSRIKITLSKPLSAGQKYALSKVDYCDKKRKPPINILRRYRFRKLPTF